MKTDKACTNLIRTYYITMTLLEAFKHIQYFAENYTKGNVTKAVEALEASYEHITDESKEAVDQYKEWQQRMNAWLEYVK